mmetsp:Transcript_16383/g.26388  ORF Transcript_16383/g.26388 Transcript_16383/m.26388 type:complete len:202 (-) Transcript_16383:498-1103(-)
MSSLPQFSIRCRLASSAGMNVFIRARGLDGTRSAFHAEMSSASRPMRNESSLNAGRLFVTPPSTQIMPRCRQSPGWVQVGMYPAAITASMRSSLEVKSDWMWLCGTGRREEMDMKSRPFTRMCASAGSVQCRRYRQNWPTFVRWPKKAAPRYASAMAGMCAQMSAGCTPHAATVATSAPMLAPENFTFLMPSTPSASYIPQ